jgi:hypothetical protein
MEDVRFRHDAAPAYFTLAVREFLSEAFCGFWIGRVSVTFPSRCVILTPNLIFKPSLLLPAPF